MKQKTVIWGTLLIGLAAASPSSANIFKVGTGTGCTHSTIQAAVDAANANPGVDHIILTRSVNYTQQAIKIQQAQPLTLTGGYAACADNAPSGERTIVRGNGGSANSVFTVEPGSSDVLFDNLFITGGDESDNYYGGGIDFTGSGNLTLSDVTLTQNTSGYGGGLSARGTGPDATVLFVGDTIINNNVATQDGGGVHLRGTVTLYALESKTAIWLNRATGLANVPNGIYHGYGGGMAVVGPAKAYIGSSGYSLGTIYGNTARVGGAVAALIDSGNSSRVYLFTTDPTKPQKVSYNRATDVGGAFYSDAKAEPFDGPRGYIQLWDTTIENNSAPSGSIAYLVGDSIIYPVPSTWGGFLSMNVSGNSRPAVSVPCNPGVLCSVVNNNRSEDAVGNPSNSALIYGVEEAHVHINGVRFTGNSARSMLDLAESAYVTVTNTLIDNNTFTAAVLQFPEGDPDVELNHLTITDNIIGGPGVIAHRGHVELNRSIIWQPGKTVRATAASSGTFDGSDVHANETASIPNVANSYHPFPVGFMNPTLKDYRLRAGSELVDVLAYDAALDDTLDVDGFQRSVKLPLVPFANPVDYGAYERQSIGNIMVNDSFNSDLSQWTLPIPSIVSRNTDNGNGPNGSGSLRVDGTRLGGPASLTVAKQCQVLPGPGMYKVTGWGRSLDATMFSPGDGLRVHWKVFTPTMPPNPLGYGCTGLNIGEGDVVIPAGTSWLLSPTAGQFDISVDDAYANAAVEISLVAIDIDPPDLQGFRNFSVAFDGITLEASNDLIFANGFD